MRFNDIINAEEEIEKEIDPEVAFFGDLRRKRLTLEHINKQRLKFVKTMYARPPAT
jgi:hypothetical protein